MLGSETARIGGWSESTLRREVGAWNKHRNEFDLGNTATGVDGQFTTADT